MLLTVRIRRLLRLTGVVLGVALLLMALYWRRTDTVTLKLVAHALSAPAGTDSTFYMRMGERAFQQSGPHLYQQLFFAEHQKFIYPPSSLLLIEAVDGVASRAFPAERIWKMLMFGSWLGSILLAALFFREESEGRRTSALELIAVAVLGVLFLPFAEAFFRGQVQMLLTALWGASALLFTKRKTAWAGALLALTCAFKPQLAIFLLWGVLRRDWRFTASFSAVGAVVSAASLARFGLQNHIDYLAVLRELSRHGEALAANQSVAGALHRLLRNGDAASWSYTVYPPFNSTVYFGSTAFSVACLLVGLLLPKLYGWAGTTFDFLLFGCLSVLISPIAWEHHYGYYFFAIVALLARAEALSPAAWTALCLVLLGMSNRLPWLDGLVAGPSSLGGDYLLLSSLLLLALLVHQARKKELASGAREWANARHSVTTTAALAHS